jgi:hypothetical protein
MLKVTTRDLGNEVEIRVRDDGAGIAPEFREKLFPPFFTPSRPAKAPGSACQSAGTSSPSSTAALSLSTVTLARSPSLPLGYHGGEQGERQHPGGRR